MRVLLGTVVVETSPGLIQYFYDHDPDSRVEGWIPNGSVGASVEKLSDFQPDVLVLYPGWLVLNSVLLRMLDLSGCRHTRRVLASEEMNNVLKIEAAYHGFFDVLDLGRSDAVLFDALRDVHAGVSSLDSDRLWRTVDRPSSRVDVSLVPRDEFDRSILELLRMGLGDREIADVVCLSSQTVRNRVSAMLQRSGLDNRTHLAWTYTNAKLVDGMFRHLDLHEAGHLRGQITPCGVAPEESPGRHRTER